MKTQETSVAGEGNAPRWIDMQDMDRNQVIDYAIGLSAQRDELLAATRRRCNPQRREGAAMSEDLQDAFSEALDNQEWEREETRQIEEQESK